MERKICIYICVYDGVTRVRCSTSGRLGELREGGVNVQMSIASSFSLCRAFRSPVT